MVIGIIGASLSGLIAGKKLAKAGHDVTIIEKNRSLGGRLATTNNEHGIVDYGLPFITGQNPVFQSFINELVDQDILYKWAEEFPLHDGSQYHDVNPNRTKETYYAGRKGLQPIAHHLKRWVDIQSNVNAGGLTYIGGNRTKKRAWMINLSDTSVFECDAVIIATPAPQAYGLLLTAQDETPARRIIRYVDEIEYHPRYVLSASYDNQEPSWKGIECNGETLAWIGNESSKHEHNEQLNIAIHSSAQFARKYAAAPAEKVSRMLTQRAGQVAGDWLNQPQEMNLQFWKYYEAINPMEEYFMELEMEEAPLALIGDYLKGNSAESAYVSGKNLAEYWIEKHSVAQSQS